MSSVTKGDKKAEGGAVLYSVPDKLGHCLHGVELNDDIVKAAVKAAAQL